MNAIRINKHESKVLKWLQSAASKDTDREAINGINSNGNYAAVDGWRLHAVPGNNEPDLPQGMLVQLPEGTRQYGKIPADGLIEVPEAMPYEFPDYSQIIPKVEPGQDRDNPIMEIAVNPQFLIDALKGFLKSSPETCYIRVHGPNKPIEIMGKIETKDGCTPAYALVMPMHIDNPNYWKP